MLCTMSPCIVLGPKVMKLEDLALTPHSRILVHARVAEVSAVCETRNGGKRRVVKPGAQLWSRNPFTSLNLGHALAKSNLQCCRLPTILST